MYHTESDFEDSLFYNDLQFIASNETSTLFSSNQNRSLLNCKYEKDKFSVCFRLYSAIDLFRIVYLEDKIKSLVEISSNDLSLQLYVSEFYGETIFSCFYKYPYVFDLVHKQVKEMELDPDDIYIRKLFYTLSLPFKH